MEPTLRQSMNWLHTWTGVVLGSVLFAIFWMGTLSVFDKEIDLWMSPMNRIAAAPGSFLPDSQRLSYAEAIAAQAPTWNIFFPTERTPTAGTFWGGSGGLKRRFANPATGELLPDSGTLGASGFLYPFHYTLNLRAYNVGLWIVGAASMAMLVLCISGVIIHRKIFADFFTFRPDRKPRRAILDFHNIAGVLGLPFHIAITFSGVIVFFYLYFPVGWMSVYGPANLRSFNQEMYAGFARPRTGKPGELASLNAMTDSARKLWPGVDIASLTVYYPGDAAAYVQINGSTLNRVSNSGNTAIFDGKDGALLYNRLAAKPVFSLYRFMFGMHVIQFEHWTLRWLYFLLGISGCVLIATGFLFWLESRRARHAELGLHGVRVVEAISTGSTTGIIAATLAFFVANKLLPTGLDGRAGLEVTIFYSVWAATFIHAGFRPGLAGWKDQCWIVAALALASVVLNAVITGDHPIRSLASASLRAVGIMDLLLLLTAAVAALAAIKIATSARHGATRSIHA